MRPLFTCVMPVKGKRPFMDEALASLRDQGLGEALEIVIQDGDAEPDGGQSEALNRGFAKAHGEWLFWLNADDVMLPGALQKIRNLLASPSDGATRVSWIAGNVAYLDCDGRILRCAWDRGWRCTYRNLHAQVYGPSSFFRRELLEACGPFDPTLSYAMDIDMWCRFRKAGYWYRKVSDLVWGFRIHEGSKTREAQLGGWPEGIAAEHHILDGRYGLKPNELNRSLARCVRLANGSYVTSFWLTHRYRQHAWKEVVA